MASSDTVLPLVWRQTRGKRLPLTPEGRESGCTVARPVVGRPLRKVKRSVAVNGKIRIVDDVPTPFGPPEYSHQVGYHPNGVPLCHSTGQPVKCVRQKGDDCWQCCYDPWNIRNEGWYE